MLDLLRENLKLMNLKMVMFINVNGSSLNRTDIERRAMLHILIFSLVCPVT